MIIKTVSALTLACCVAGCVGSAEKSESQPPDGVYRISERGTHEVVWLRSMGAPPVAIRVEEYSDYLPKRVDAFAVGTQKTNWSVRMHGTANRARWSEEPLIVMAGGKAYRLTQAGSVAANDSIAGELSVIMSFQVRSPDEAAYAVLALRERFSL